MMDNSVEAIVDYEKKQYICDLESADWALKSLYGRIAEIREEIAAAEKSEILPSAGHFNRQVENINYYAQHAMEQLLNAQHHGEMAKAIGTLKDE